MLPSAQVVEKAKVSMESALRQQSYSRPNPSRLVLGGVSILPRPGNRVCERPVPTMGASSAELNRFNSQVPIHNIFYLYRK